MIVILTVEIQIIHTTDVGLSLSTYESYTIHFTAMTNLRFVSLLQQ